jgi:hypothetical protein
MTSQQQIAATLDAMFATWNGGEQARYLTFYWDHDDLRWSMKGLWYKGLSSMRAVYGQGFPREAMGTIAKTDLEVMMLADDLGIALYRWTHDLPGEHIAGCTSQVFRRFGDAWLVVHENSARVPRD